MAEKEYIVILNPDVDFAQFNQEMIDTTGAGVIPSRRVDVANPRPGSQRSTHYSLTDEEAEELKNDSRVTDVELRPQDRDDIEKVFFASQSGNFEKTTSDSGNAINWGIRRCMENTNPYGTSNINPGGDFTYNLDGTGVDVVIQDSGIQPDHPEFEDENGVSRVQEIDWYAESGLPGTQHELHYRDFEGHGTHCAGIAASKTYGWAKNARIYSVKARGLEGPGDFGESYTYTSIDDADIFDVIKLWHRNKPIDPETGYKRPTIVNMSWGYNRAMGSYAEVERIRYRDVEYNDDGHLGATIDPLWQSSIEHMAETYGLILYGQPNYAYHPTRIASVDADLEELIAEGVHVCVAAGNSGFKSDVESGIDYDNAITGWGGFWPLTFEYHQGSSPYSDNAFMVGSIDSDTHSGGLEQKSDFSNCGPSITLWAPGSNIMSCTSTINTHDGGDYPGDPNYKICNISGTSMAAPQVCGLGATILELNPHLTPTQLKQKMVNLATNNALYSTGNDDDYTNDRTLNDAPNKILYTPFNSSTSLSIG